MTGAGVVTMREACKLIGWHDEYGKVTPSLMRKLRRKLTAASKGEVKYIFGAGEGQPAWTTARLLTEVGLLSNGAANLDIDELADGMKEGVAALRQDLRANARHFAELSRSLESLTAVVMGHDETLQAMRRRLGMS